MESMQVKLTGYVSGHEDILVVYLFGSQATGQPHSKSDMDVALLFRPENIPSTDQFLQIQDDLTSLLKKEVDIVILNDASLIIRMQVPRKGKKLFERDRRAFSHFLSEPSTSTAI